MVNRTEPVRRSAAYCQYWLLKTAEIIRMIASLLPLISAVPVYNGRIDYHTIVINIQ